MFGVLTSAVRIYQDRWGYGIYSGPIGTAVLMITVKWVREREKGTDADAAHELRNIVSCDRRCKCEPISQVHENESELTGDLYEHMSYIFRHPCFQEQRPKRVRLAKN